MLLEDTTQLRVNPNNYKYLNSIGYKNIKNNDIITISISDLSIGSGHKIKVKCDICEKEKMLSYRRYMLSYNNGGYYACSNSCNIEKRKYEHTDIIKENNRIKCLEKYGVNHYFKTNEFKEKIKKTNIERYGVDNVFKNEKIKENIKKTNIQRYGVDNPSKSEIIKLKKEETCLKNNGVKSPCQNSSIFEKNLKSGLKIKKFKNTELNYQGSYELDFLNNFYDKIEIKKGLTINYRIDDKEKYYHSDYYIPNIDLIIEIKSTYWYNKCKKLNIIKEKFAKKQHNYIIILDKKYEEFLKIIK